MDQDLRIICYRMILICQRPLARILRAEQEMATAATPSSLCAKPPDQNQALKSPQRQNVHHWDMQAPQAISPSP